MAAVAAARMRRLRAFATEAAASVRQAATSVAHSVDSEGQYGVAASAASGGNLPLTASVLALAMLLAGDNIRHRQQDISLGWKDGTGGISGGDDVDRAGSVAAKRNTEGEDCWNDIFSVLSLHAALALAAIAAADMCGRAEDGNDKGTSAGQSGGGGGGGVVGGGNEGGGAVAGALNVGGTSACAQYLVHCLTVPLLAHVFGPGGGGRAAAGGHIIANKVSAAASAAVVTKEGTSLHAAQVVAASAAAAAGGWDAVLVALPAGLQGLLNADPSRRRTARALARGHETAAAAIYAAADELGVAVALKSHGPAAFGSSQPRATDRGESADIAGSGYGGSGYTASAAAPTREDLRAAGTESASEVLNRSRCGVSAPWAGGWVSAMWGTSILHEVCRRGDPTTVAAALAAAPSPAVAAEALSARDRAGRTCAGAVAARLVRRVATVAARRLRLGADELSESGNWKGEWAGELMFLVPWDDVCCRLEAILWILSRAGADLSLPEGVSAVRSAAVNESFLQNGEGGSGDRSFERAEARGRSGRSAAEILADLCRTYCDVGEAAAGRGGLHLTLRRCLAWRRQWSIAFSGSAGGRAGPGLGPDEIGRTALHAAAAVGDADTAAALIEARADLAHADWRGWTALHAAAAAATDSVVVLLLDSAGLAGISSLTSRSGHRLEASQRGRKAAGRGAGETNAGSAGSFVGVGAGVNEEGGCRGTAEELLAAMTDRVGRAALHVWNYRRAGGRAGSGFARLLAASGNVTAVTDNALGMTPLHYCAAAGGTVEQFLMIVRVLVRPLPPSQQGSTANERVDGGGDAGREWVAGMRMTIYPCWTALEAAAAAGNVDIIEVDHICERDLPISTALLACAWAAAASAARSSTSPSSPIAAGAHGGARDISARGSTAGVGIVGTDWRADTARADTAYSLGGFNDPHRLAPPARWPTRVTAKLASAVCEAAWWLLDAPAGDGCTMLGRAAAQGDAAVVRHILALGANAEAGDADKGCVPLALAASAGSLEVCAILIERGRARADRLFPAPISPRSHARAGGPIAAAAATSKGDAKDDVRSSTAPAVWESVLAAAIGAGRLELARGLIRLGEDPAIGLEIGPPPLPKSAGASPSLVSALAAAALQEPTQLRRRITPLAFLLRLAPEADAERPDWSLARVREWQRLAVFLARASPAELRASFIPQYSSPTKESKLKPISEQGKKIRRIKSYQDIIKGTEDESDALWLAISAGYTECALELIHKHRSVIDSRAYEPARRASLLAAARVGAADVVQALLQRGDISSAAPASAVSRMRIWEAHAPMLSTTAFGAESLILEAVRSRRWKVVQVLVEHARTQSEEGAASQGADFALLAEESWRILQSVGLGTQLNAGGIDRALMALDSANELIGTQAGEAGSWSSGGTRGAWGSGAIKAETGRSATEDGLLRVMETVRRRALAFWQTRVPKKRVQWTQTEIRRACRKMLRARSRTTNRVQNDADSGSGVATLEGQGSDSQKLEESKADQAQLDSSEDAADAAVAKTAAAIISIFDDDADNPEVDLPPVDEQGGKDSKLERKILRKGKMREFILKGKVVSRYSRLPKVPLPSLASGLREPISSSWESQEYLDWEKSRSKDQDESFVAPAAPSNPMRSEKIVQGPAAACSIVRALVERADVSLCLSDLFELLKSLNATLSMVSSSAAVRLEVTGERPRKGHIRSAHPSHEESVSLRQQEAKPFVPKNEQLKSSFGRAQKCDDSAPEWHASTIFENGIASPIRAALSSSGQDAALNSDKEECVAALWKLAPLPLHPGQKVDALRTRSRDDKPNQTFERPLGLPAIIAVLAATDVILRGTRAIRRVSDSDTSRSNVAGYGLCNSAGDHSSSGIDQAEGINRRRWAGRRCGLPLSFAAAFGDRELLLECVDSGLYPSSSLALDPVEWWADCTSCDPAHSLAHNTTNKPVSARHFPDRRGQKHQTSCLELAIKYGHIGHIAPLLRAESGNKVPSGSVSVGAVDALRQLLTRAPTASAPHGATFDPLRTRMWANAAAQLAECGIANANRSAGAARVATAREVGELLEGCVRRGYSEAAQALLADRSGIFAPSVQSGAWPEFFFEGRAMAAALDVGDTAVLRVLLARGVTSALLVDPRVSSVSGLPNSSTRGKGVAERAMCGRGGWTILLELINHADAVSPAYFESALTECHQLMEAGPEIPALPSSRRALKARKEGEGRRSMLQIVRAGISKPLPRTVYAHSRLTSQELHIVRCFTNLKDPNADFWRQDPAAENLADGRFDGKISTNPAVLTSEVPPPVPKPRNAEMRYERPQQAFRSFTERERVETASERVSAGRLIMVVARRMGISVSAEELLELSDSAGRALAILRGPAAGAALAHVVIAPRRRRATSTGRGQLESILALCQSKGVGIGGNIPVVSIVAAAIAAAELCIHRFSSPSISRSNTAAPLGSFRNAESLTAPPPLLALRCACAEGDERAMAHLLERHGGAATASLMMNAVVAGDPAGVLSVTGGWPFRSPVGHRKRRVTRHLTAPSDSTPSLSKLAAAKALAAAASAVGAVDEEDRAVSLLHLACAGGHLAAFEAVLGWGADAELGWSTAHGTVLASALHSLLIFAPVRHDVLSNRGGAECCSEEVGGDKTRGHPPSWERVAVCLAKTAQVRVDLAPDGMDMLSLAISKGYWECAEALTKRKDFPALFVGLGSALCSAIRAGCQKLVNSLASALRGREGGTDETLLLERALLDRGRIPGGPSQNDEEILSILSHTARSFGRICGLLPIQLAHIAARLGHVAPMVCSLGLQLAENSERQKSDSCPGVEEDMWKGRTLLMSAACAKSTGTLQKLLAHGFRADKTGWIDIRGRDGRERRLNLDAVCFAWTRGTEAATLALLHAGLPPPEPNMSGTSPGSPGEDGWQGVPASHIACGRGMVHAVHHLLRQDAGKVEFVEAKDSYGYSLDTELSFHHSCAPAKAVLGFYNPYFSFMLSDDLGPGRKLPPNDVFRMICPDNQAAPWMWRLWNWSMHIRLRRESQADGRRRRGVVSSTEKQDRARERAEADWIRSAMAGLFGGATEEHHRRACMIAAITGNIEAWTALAAIRQCKVSRAGAGQFSTKWQQNLMVQGLWAACWSGFDALASQIFSELVSSSEIFAPDSILMSGSKQTGSPACRGLESLIELGTARGCSQLVKCVLENAHSWIGREIRPCSPASLVEGMLTEDGCMQSEAAATDRADVQHVRPNTPLRTGWSDSEESSPDIRNYPARGLQPSSPSKVPVMPSSGIFAVSGVAGGEHLLVESASVEEACVARLLFGVLGAGMFGAALQWVDLGVSMGIIRRLDSACPGWHSWLKRRAEGVNPFCGTQDAAMVGDIDVQQQGAASIEYMAGRGFGDENQFLLQGCLMCLLNIFSKEGVDESSEHDEGHLMAADEPAARVSSTGSVVMVDPPSPTEGLRRKCWGRECDPGASLQHPAPFLLPELETSVAATPPTAVQPAPAVSRLPSVVSWWLPRAASRSYRTSAASPPRPWESEYRGQYSWPPLAAVTATREQGFWRSTAWRRGDSAGGGEAQRSDDAAAGGGGSGGGGGGGNECGSDDGTGFRETPGPGAYFDINRPPAFSRMRIGPGLGLGRRFLPALVVPLFVRDPLREGAALPRVGESLAQ